MLGTPTSDLNVAAAEVRFCTPGKLVPMPLWHPEQIGPNISACSCVKVAGAAPFDTVTATAGDVPTLPSASVAVAVRLTDPFVAVVVFHATLKGAVVAVPIEVAPAKNCTCGTLSGSITCAVSVTVPLTVVAGVLSVTTGL